MYAVTSRPRSRALRLSLRGLGDQTVLPAQSGLTFGATPQALSLVAKLAADPVGTVYPGATLSQLSPGQIAYVNQQLAAVGLPLLPGSSSTPAAPVQPPPQVQTVQQPPQQTVQVPPVYVPPSTPPQQTAQVPPVYVPPATQPQQPTPQPAETAPQGQPLSIILTNLSRPGQSFQVGDLWQLVITGPANAPVVDIASQNGQSLGSTPYGTTDATGTFKLTGTMQIQDAGSWTESWSVGGSMLPVLSFTVTEPVTDQSNFAYGPLAQSLTATETDAATLPVVTTVAPSWLSEDTILSVAPNWMVLTAAAAIAYAFFGRKR